MIPEQSHNKFSFHQWFPSLVPVSVEGHSLHPDIPAKHNSYNFRTFYTAFRKIDARQLSSVYITLFLSKTKLKNCEKQAAYRHKNVLAF